MKKKTKILFGGGSILLLLMLALPLSAENINSKEYPFLHFSSSNSGLSYNYINGHTIMQDSRGFVWIGTHNGLNRYDGNKFRVYYKEELGTESDMITSLCEDSEGNIWIGTQTDLIVYDPLMNVFTRFDKLSDKGTLIRNKVTRIKLDDKGVVWMAVNKQGLFSYDPSDGAFRNHFVQDGIQSIPTDIVTFAFDEDHRLYLSLYFSGLYAADESISEISPVTMSTGVGKKLWENDNIIEIIRSDYNTFYIASRDKGVCEYNPSENTVRPLFLDKGNGTWITSLIMDDNHKLWATTSTGVMSYNLNNAEIMDITRRGIDGFDLSRGRPNSICIDSMGGIWVGTYNNGVNYSRAFAGNFSQYYRTEKGRAIYGCAGFAEDDFGNVWIATMDSGLLQYNPKTDIVKEYVNHSIPNTLLGIHHDNGRLWLGSQKGVYSIDIRTGATKSYRRGLNVGLNDNYSYVIYSTSSGELLIGTTLGLLRYDAGKDAFISVDAFKGLYVLDMTEDRNGELWVATSSSGLFRYSLASDRVIRNYSNHDAGKSLPCNIILSVIEDSKGRIWASSFESGLLRYEPQNDSFRIYEYSVQEMGISSIFNSRIVEDDEGYLWLPSNKGFIRFSPETSSMRNYTVKDGLLNNEINEKSGICLSDGSIMFGSIDGFVRFNPQTFINSDTVPDVVITDFYVNGSIVTAGSASSPLETGIDRTERIVLKSNQNSFGFDLAVPDAASPAHNSLYCKLEGYDRQWQRPLLNSSVSYSNIPAGKYSFIVRSIGDKGMANDTHHPIEIVVRPVFYKSALAYILYILLLSGTLFGIIYYFYRRYINRTRSQQREYKKAKEMELFNEKLTFFSHIVHEIKTPLTLIHTPLRNIMSSGNWSDEINDDLKIISDNTDYLKGLVNELLDFVRIERRGYVLDCENMDIVEKLRNHVFNFTDIAKNKNIRISFSCEEEHIHIWADNRSMDKILGNLLLNAVKYSESVIEVEVHSSDGNAVVTVANDGYPIPMELRTEIFKPFVQYHSEERNVSSGVGIGLSLARNLALMQAGSLELSDESECTRFVLTIPLSDALAMEEKREAAEENVGHADDSRCSLLIVDDNLDLQNYLGRKLGQDYSVIMVSSGNAALDVLKKQYVDIVLSDLSMPGMNGLDLCRTIRADVEISHLPIVILSARSSVESKILAMEAGATIYIEKPFDLDYLRACLRSIADKRILMHNVHLNGVVINDISIYELPKKDEQMLLRLDRFIESNITSDLSPNVLAEELAMSESTLTRKLRSMLNTSPANYVQVKRLNMAARYLEKGNYRINEVCYSVGFNSPSYFTKCFKNFYGCLPKEYQERHYKQ